MPAGCDDRDRHGAHDAAPPDGERIPMRVFGFGDPVVPDYLVLVFLLVGFLLAGLVRLVVHLMDRGSEDQRERENYTDQS